MSIPLAQADRTLLRRAASARAAGKSWNQTAGELHTDAESLEQLARDNHRLYRRYWFKADRAALTEVRQEGMLCLRGQLRDDDTKTAQRAADVIGRIEVNRARVYVQADALRTRVKLAKMHWERKDKKTDTSTPAERTAAAPVALRESLLDPPPPLPEVAPRSMDAFRQMFPPTQLGTHALEIFTYLTYATAETIAADRERDFREQCFNRQIQLPDAEPLPY